MQTTLALTADEELKTSLEEVSCRMGTQVCFDTDHEDVVSSCTLLDPNVIIVDLSIKNIDVFRCIQELDAIVSSSIPIVALYPTSAFGYTNLARNHALRSGATFFLVKPLNFEILIDFLSGLSCFCDHDGREAAEMGRCM